MKKFYEPYYDFYITIKDDLTVKSKYIGESGKPKLATEKIVFNQDLNDIIEELEDTSRDPLNPLTRGRIKEGGKLLYDALFVGEIGVDFSNAFDEIDKKGCGLRILLDIAPKHTGKPWELARYKNKFLATDIRTPFLRIYAGKTQGVNLGEGKMPRVLSILSNVESKYAVDVPAELKNLQHILLKGRSRANFGGFKDVFADGKAGGDPGISGAPSLLDIEEFLNSVAADPLEAPFNVIHFLAHGHFDDENDLSTIVLWEGKDEIEAEGTDLAETFGNERSIGLIILNACSTGKILSSNSPCLVSELLDISPAVVAMRKGIEKDTAKAFTYYFYRCFTPQNAEVAIQSARKLLLKRFEETIDFSIPVLYLGCDQKTGIPAKRIFEKTQTIGPLAASEPSLNLAGLTIQTLLELHDTTLEAEAEWNDWFLPENYNTYKEIPPTVLKKTLFGKFNKSLSKISGLICDTFSHTVPIWKKGCTSLDLEMTKLVEEVKKGNKSKFQEWKQNYEKFETVISHIITSRMEVK